MPVCAELPAASLGPNRHGDATMHATRKARLTKVRAPAESRSGNVLGGNSFHATTRRHCEADEAIQGHSRGPGLLPPLRGVAMTRTELFIDRCGAGLAPHLVLRAGSARAADRAHDLVVPD